MMAKDGPMGKLDPMAPATPRVSLWVGSMVCFTRLSRGRS